MARVLMDSGRLEPAARLLGAYAASGYGVTWSATVAQPLIDKIQSEHPELLDTFSEGSALAGAALCQACLDELAVYLGLPNR